MGHSFEIRPAAEVEFDEAADRYRLEDKSLCDRFVHTVDICISKITERPFSFPVVEGSHVRRAIVERFPFAVYFILDETHVVILSIFHTSRNPIIWRGRID